MKTLLIALTIILSTISARADDTLSIEITGIVKKCCKIDKTEPYNICINFDGFTWGFEIPNHNPKINSKAKALLTLGNYNDKATGEYMLRVEKFELVVPKKKK